MPDRTRPLRIAVVDDHEVVVVGLAALLAPYAERVEVVALDRQRLTHTANGAPGGLGDVDVVLVDTVGPARDRGPGVADRVRLGSARGGVFSWNADSGAVGRALAQGAAGHLAKGADAETMVSTLEAAHAGTPVEPAEQTGRTRGAWPGQSDGLTAREAEVLSLITQGLSNQEIADRCYLSINSVKTYIRTAYRKMGVTRRSQAVLWGLAHGFEPDRGRPVDHEV